MFKALFRWVFRWIYWLVLLVWCLAMVVLGFWLQTENTVSVQASFFGFTYEHSLGFFMTTILAAGFLLGFLPLFLATLVRDLRFRRKIRKTQKEVDGLRAQAVGG